MKKIYVLLVLALTALNTSFLAQNSLIKAPAFSTTVSTAVAPNGTSLHTVQRGCFLLTASELTVVGTNTAINSVGFYLNQGTNGPAVTGTIQIYLQNCADVTYLKGNNFATAIGPMSSVYNNTLTIPAIFGTTAINVSLPANFTYTGGGLYVAYDWISTGPFATGAAIFQADNTLGNAGAFSSATIAPAPNIMSNSGTRPVFQIGYVNTYTNEAQVYGVLGNGRQPLINGSPYTFSVVLRNNSGVAMTNVVPTISVTGANSFVSTTTVASIPAGGTLIASFPPFTPTTQGISTVAVTVPADQNNLNNASSITQSITCNYMNSGPIAPIANFNQGVGFQTSSGLLLNIISVPNTSTLNALRLGIANYNGNPGNGVYGVVTNSSGVILATTNTIVITGAMFSTYQTFSFASPVTLNPNLSYYVGMAQPSNVVSYFPLASMPTPTNNIPPNLYATSILGGGLIFPATPTLGVFAIESVFENGISLTVTPISSTVCSGTPVSITASGATTYSWSNGANTSTINVTPNVFTAYTCTGSAIVGTVGTCEDIKTSNVFVNITPTINCPNGAICPVGGSYTMAPSGAATYTYAGGGPIVTPTVTSNFTITGTSGAGCPSLPKIVTVSVQPNVTVAISGPTIMCDGNNVVLNASGASTYSWSPGALSGSSVIVAPSVTTTYTLSGSFGSCSNTAVQTVSVSPQLTVQAFSSPTTICVGNTATLNAFGQAGAGTTSYSWSTGSTLQAIAVSPTITTTYSVSGVSNGVCSSFTTVTVLVDPCIGIKELNGSSADIKIYPNPNSGSFAITVSSITNNSIIELYNSLGQMVLQQKINDTNTNVNLTSLAKGVYILQLKENNYSVKTARMVVQ